MALPALASLLAVTALALSAPAALAADATVQVGDDFFEPDAVQIDPGNTVTWEWVGLMGNHSVTTRSGQVERFDSDPGNDNPRHAPGSTPFTYRFNQVGLIKYYCKLHPSTMNGTVTVGTPPPDTTPPSMSAAAARVGARRVRIAFNLSEDAAVVVRIGTRSRPGTTLRSRSEQLTAGRRSLTFRRRGLPRRRYRVTITATDAAGNEAVDLRTGFRIRPR